MYIKSFGNSNSNQVGIQTNDDYQDREIQTEDYQVQDKWIQNTPDTILEVGSNEAQTKTKLNMKIANVSSSGLKFLKKATKIIEDLLLEEQGISLSENIYEPAIENTHSFSEGFLSVTIPISFKESRKLIKASTNSIDSQLIISSWSCSKNLSDSFNNYSILLISNFANNNSKSTLLLASSNIISYCIPKNHPYLIFGGTEDGSIIVWDLKNDDPTLSHIKSINNQTFNIHYHSYNTTAQYTQKKGHENKIISLQTIDTISKDLSNGPGSKDRPFKLISIDANGLLQNWVKSFIFIYQKLTLF